MLTSSQLALAPTRRAPVRLVLRLDLERSAYQRQFGELAVPTEAQLSGRFRGLLLGPVWLRALARRSLALVGLRRPWGLELAGFGPAYNLLGRGAELVRGMPMQLGLTNSLLDERLCASLRRDDGGRAEQRPVRYELRVAGDGCLLGMGLVVLPLVGTFAFPFMLARV